MGRARGPGQPPALDAGGELTPSTAVDRLEAVVFDVDGTLVDSERDGHRVAFNAAFEEAGLPDRWDVATYGRLLTITGGARRIAHWLEATGRSADQARELSLALHRRKTAIVREMVLDGLIGPRPGVRRLLADIEASGAAMHVATTGTRSWVDPLLEKLFGNPFKVVVTGSEVTDLKPSPAAYLEVLAQAGCDPARTVAVEDSSNGLRAAVAAGLPCVVAQNEYTRGQDFSGAALVADGMDDPVLVDWVATRLPAGTHR